MIPHRDGRHRLLDRVEQFRAGEDHDAGAGKRQHPAAVSGVGVEIVVTAFDRPERDGVNDRPRLEACLDREQTAHFPQHTQSLAILNAGTAQLQF
jgi:hypothetical protein